MPGHEPRGCVAVFYQSFEKDDGGCWLWTGPKEHLGYGIINLPNRDGRSPKYRAHRLSLQLASGEMGDGLYACHHCDTPACVRPDHLFWGTQTDNMGDAALKGRHRGGEFNASKTHCPKGHPLSEKRKANGSRYCPTCSRARHRQWYELNRQKDREPPAGERHGMAKLTADQIRDIRTSALSARELAAKHAVTPGYINHIKRRRVWRHVP